MQNQEALQGWMFVNHIARQIVALIYRLIHEKQVTGKCSINDLIIHLIHIRQILIHNAWTCAEITASTKQMLKKLHLSVT